MKHIEINCNSLAECYARLRESDLIYVSDLGHKAFVTIDIDTDSPFDGSYIHIPDYTKSKEEKPTLTVEDIKTILDLSFWNNDPQKILDEYNRLHQTKA